MCFVDEIKTYERIKPEAKKWGNEWCHLMCDTTDELNGMAKRLGVFQKWIQDKGKPTEHYDLIPYKRMRAVLLGAAEMSFREMLARKGAL